MEQILLERFYSVCKQEANTEPLPKLILEKYRGLVPVEIIELWQYGGVGSYMNDFFWVINPDEYLFVTDQLYKPFLLPCVVFARDAFGDLFVWEKDCVKFVNVRHGYSQVIGRDLKIFFNSIATDWDFFCDRLKAKDFSSVKARLHGLSYDECYGYVPALVAGGSDKPENVQKVKLREYLEIIAQFGQPIR